MAILDEEEAEQERREAALAATAILQPDFKSSNVSQSMLDKFKELNQRRLQLKEKSKHIGKSKRKASQVVKARSGLIEDDCKSKLVKSTIEGSNLSTVKGKGIQDDDVAATVPRKKKRLHWGLEAKERWERKANM